MYLILKINNNSKFGTTFTLIRSSETGRIYLVKTNSPYLWKL